MCIRDSRIRLARSLVDRNDGWLAQHNPFILHMNQHRRSPEVDPHILRRIKYVPDLFKKPKCHNLTPLKVFSKQISKQNCLLKKAEKQADVIFYYIR